MTADMKLLYKFPTRSRVQKLFNCLDNIVTQQNDKENYEIIISADTDDKEMACEETINRARHLKNDRINLVFGQSRNKVEAYNRDIEKATIQWDILLTVSDDMWFTHPGFDSIIRADMQKVFPDTDGMLHYSDGNQKDNVCTMSILGRKYYERFNYVYHPSYVSLFCDNEQTDVAKRLNKYIYLGDDKLLFKHFHPAWGHGKMDDLYRRNEARHLWLTDEKNFYERKKRNFDL